MGVPSTVRRPPSGARQQAGTLMSLAPCPVEDCPVGGCIRRFPPSTSHCLLRCGNQPHFPFGNYPLIFRASSFCKSARRTAPTSLSSRLFQVAQRPRFLFLELKPIPVHGYDSRSRPFPPMSTRGRTCASSHMRHAVQPHGSPHSTAVIRAVTARCGLTYVRRPDRREVCSMRGESGQNRLRMPGEGTLECAGAGLFSVADLVPECRLPRLFTVPFEQAFAPAPRFPTSLLGTLTPHPVNRPLPQSARNNGPDFPFSHLFQVQNSPRLPFWELAPIPVHGYDISSSSSPPISGPHPRRQTNDPSGTTTRPLPLRPTSAADRGCARAVSGGRGGSAQHPDYRLRRTFPLFRPRRVTKCCFQSWRCPTRSDFSDDTLSTSKAEAVQSPWEEPRSQSVYRIRPVEGRSMPVAACTRPILQPLHQTQIPVHGYDAGSVPSNLPPCEGGLCASPGSYAVPPHAPLPRHSRLLRLVGRQTDSDRLARAHPSPAK